MTLLKEFFRFLREEKAWWMIPMLVVLAVVGVLIFTVGAALPTVGAYPIW